LILLPCGARKAVKERAWRDDREILPLNLGPARLGRNVGRWGTITVCADFVGIFGRKGARLFARML
jgi:hypothetical protein